MYVSHLCEDVTKSTSESSPPLVAPMRVHVVDNRGLLQVSMDGDLQWLDPDDLKGKGPTVRPFPSTMTKSVISNDCLIGFWVEHDLLAARMACIPLNTDFKQGVTKAEVRATMSDPAIASMVAGASWTHILDAEPLGLAVLGDGLAFCLWKRGIYCIEIDATERWRQPELHWEMIGNLPRGQELCCLQQLGDDLVAWSRGGGWARISHLDGDIVEEDVIEVPASITAVDYNDDGGWLLCSNRGHLLRFKQLGDTPLIVDVTGPVSTASWCEDIRGWRMCGWREDLTWTDGEITRVEREDLGVHLMKHDGRWLVLDNKGVWSPFKDE